MPDEEPLPIAKEVDEVLFRAIGPDIADAYTELKREYQQLFDQERKACKQAERYLRKRKAPREQFEELRVKREEEVRRLREEFKRRVTELLDRAG